MAIKENRRARTGPHTHCLLCGRSFGENLDDLPEPHLCEECQESNSFHWTSQAILIVSVFLALYALLQQWRVS